MLGVSCSTASVANFYANIELDLLHKKAEEGDSSAQLELGIYYKNKISVGQTYETAMKFLFLAAEQGDAEAAYQLGDLFLHDCPECDKKTLAEFIERGQQQLALNDHRKIYPLEVAVQWFKAAAEKGHTLAAAACQYPFCPGYFDVEEGRVADPDGKIRQALKEYEEKLAVEKECEYKKGFFKPVQAMLLAHIGYCYTLLGRYEDALEAHKNAYAIWVRMYGDESRHAARSLNNMSVNLCYLGNYEKAVKKCASALKMQVMEGEESATVSNTLAYGYFGEGKFDIACIHCISLFYESGRFDRTHISVTLYNMSLCYRGNRDYHASIPFIYSFYNEFDDSSISPSLSISYWNCTGDSQFARGLFNDALESYNKAYAMCEEALLEENHLALTSLHNIARCEAALERFEQAIGKEEKALALSRKLYGENHSYTAKLIRSLASFLSFVNKPKSLAMCAKAVRILSNTNGENHPNTVQAQNSYDAILFPYLARQVQEREPELSQVDFFEMTTSALQYLQETPMEKIKIYQNPTGFVFIVIPVPEGFNSIEYITLNYWPDFYRGTYAEEPHTHFALCECLVLQGGYTRILYQPRRDNALSSFKFNRIFLDGNEEKLIFSLGDISLEETGREEAGEDEILCFPSSLIRQIHRVVPNTLTMHCFFDDENAKEYFDLFGDEKLASNPMFFQDLPLWEQPHSIIPEMLSILKRKSEMGG